MNTILLYILMNIIVVSKLIKPETQSHCKNKFYKYSVIMKKIGPAGYYQNGFVATHALGHIYIMLILLLGDLSTLCRGSLMTTYIYIIYYMYIYIYIYIYYIYIYVYIIYVYMYICICIYIIYISVCMCVCECVCVYYYAISKWRRK